MATQTLSDKITIRQVARRGRPLESYFWLFMRLSGAGLLFLAVGHWVMIHFIQGVQNVTSDWVVQARWAYTWIRVWDFLLLGLAFVHGLNGFHTVVTDYVHDPKWLRAIRITIIIGGAIVLFLGAVAIIALPMT